ncbi:MAG: hypothetical protein IT258_17430, partial [Saprospiraceae bacterium]|nr:hypothetical protein [Saprospiraceae bacterium]
SNDNSTTATQNSNENNGQSPAQVVAPLETGIVTLSLLEIQPFLIPVIAPQLQFQPLEIGEKEPKPERRDWSLAAMGGTVVSFSKYSGSSPSGVLRNDHSSPWFGYQYGLSGNAPIGKKSNLVLGIGRQVAFQNIDISTERMLLDTVPVVHTNYFVVGGRTNSTTKDTVVNATERNRLVHYNEMRTLQGQLAWSRNFGKGKWSFVPQTGLTIGYVTKAEGFTVAADGAIMAFGKSNPIFRKLQFGGFVGMNVERNLTTRLSAVLNYQLHKQWNNASTEQNLAFRPVHNNLSIGLRIRLSNQ